ncbi:hypothetical protein BJY00DRAFT_278748 [Aspergillus carlsbadensis]|nr:hypothetical protein BJY00DRAFT_278748 [Aspergillus carlsbadensis]
MRMTSASVPCAHTSQSTSSLPAFKIPSLLRVIAHGEALPASDAGKPSKKKMEEVYFGSGSVENWEVEVWDFKTKEEFLIVCGIGRGTPPA